MRARNACFRVYQVSRTQACRRKKKRKERRRENARATVGSATGVLPSYRVGVVCRLCGKGWFRECGSVNDGEVRVSGKVAHPENQE